MVESYGAFGLFLLAFLAATLLPFSSEAAFGAALYGGMNHTLALAVASAGNVLAIMVNYFLGHWLRERFHTKLQTSKSGRKALHFSHHYGVWALLLSPLPIIGDPITLAAGVARINFLTFLVIAGGLRVGRYALILYLFKGTG